MEFFVNRKDELVSTDFDAFDTRYRSSAISVEGKRYCICTKCTACFRDEIKGLCTYDLLAEDNTLCADCRELRCKT